MIPTDESLEQRIGSLCESYDLVKGSIQRTGMSDAEKEKLLTGMQAFVVTLQSNPTEITYAQALQAYNLLTPLLEKQAELEQELGHTKELAGTDALTGIDNRRIFVERAQASFGRFERDATNCAILLIDLDRFKPINDTYGHLNGDAYLKKVAEIVKGQLRATDAFARFGGDEFVLIVPGKDPEGLRERIYQAFDQSTFYVKDQEKRISMSASVGIGRMTSGDQSYQDALKRADVDAYREKQGGHTRITIEGPQPNGNDLDPT